MEKTLYIYIGTPKTGTMSVRHFFAINKELFAKKYNLYCPETGIPIDAKKTQSLRHVDLFPPTDIFWRQLASETKEYPKHDILLAYENIYYFNVQKTLVTNFDIIKHTMPGYRVAIICYIRRLDDYCKAMFNQMTRAQLWKKNFFLSYPEYLTSNKKDCWQAPGFLINTIKSLIDLVGKKNLLLRIYDRKSLKNGDIISDFLDCIARELPGDAQPIQTVNQSLPAVALSLLAKDICPPLPSSTTQEILNILRAAYEYPAVADVSIDSLTAFNEEISQVDAYLPGYKNLYTNKPLSFAFPELHTHSPHEIFITSLLYRIFLNQKKQDQILKKQEEILQQQSKILHTLESLSILR